ncbi:MAG: amidohydrolase family protein [Lachnospiraceae bacterium]|nr:amidohydrolase family protein [Lachnospiraceae bacterium]
MALFEVTEYDREIYERELKDFLPEEMIDIHTHIWLDHMRRPKPLAPGEVKRTVTWPSLVAKDNSVEDLQETYRLMFPDKRVTPLMFTSGEREAFPELNNYVKECAAKTGYPALYYSCPEQSGEELEQKIREGGFLGLKSYLDLSPAYLPEKEIRIFDFFPKYQLRKMNEMKAIIMLHIPRDGRLKDPVNLAQIRELKQEFPDIRLIIAHIGRAYVESDVGNAFEVLSDCTDLMFDFCANCCEFAITKLLESVGPKRAMFGSDMPILRMRTHRIEENGTYINLIPPGLYGDPSQDRHLREVSPEEAKRITFFMYEEILAFKRAAIKLGLTKEDVYDVFCGNAKRLIEGARRDIYGA